MADFKLTRKEAKTKQSKGQISTQSYAGQTVRKTTGTPAGFVESREQVGTSTRTTTAVRGDSSETRTTNGVGKSVTQNEDQGIRVSFKIPIQARTPVQRVT